MSANDGSSTTPATKPPGFLTIKPPNRQHTPKKTNEGPKGVESGDENCRPGSYGGVEELNDDYDKNENANNISNDERTELRTASCESNESNISYADGSRTKGGHKSTRVPPSRAEQLDEARRAKQDADQQRLAQEAADKREEKQYWREENERLVNVRPSCEDAETETEGMPTKEKMVTNRRRTRGMKKKKMVKAKEKVIIITTKGARMAKLVITMRGRPSDCRIKTSLCYDDNDATLTTTMLR